MSDTTRGEQIAQKWYDGEWPRFKIVLAEQIDNEIAAARAEDARRIEQLTNRCNNFIIDLEHEREDYVNLKSQLAAAQARAEAAEGALATVAAMCRPDDGRLGEYLNSMVNECNIFNRGEYLRVFFGKFAAEVANVLAQPHGQRTGGK